MFDFNKWLQVGQGQSAKRNYEADPRYDGLPNEVKRNLDAKEFSWMDEREKQALSPDDFDESLCYPEEE